jgi:hypothetical protein
MHRRRDAHETGEEVATYKSLTSYIISYYYIILFMLYTHAHAHTHAYKHAHTHARTHSYGVRTAATAADYKI